MAFERLKYGVETDASRPRRRGAPPPARWVAVTLLAIAAVSFAAGAVRRAAPAVRRFFAAPSAPPASEGRDVRPPEAPEPGRAAVAPGFALPEYSPEEFQSRPPRVRNLILRLEEASRAGDLDMQVSTIHALRALPGDVAADIVAKLVPRLGALNMARLFKLFNPQWTATVEVRRGDSVSRLAAEHGSTPASMMKLNGWETPPVLHPGDKVRVMERPRFNMTAHGKTGEVDLFLNGALFKRYYAAEEADGSSRRKPSGQYGTTGGAGRFVAAAGFDIPAKDIAELDMLVPRGTPLVVD
ncbi:MAG: LysM peptidoglycan-binding domain-containing protein [Kiritimatiellae bacterium]|nr:LysM peptidoglycan-binding domain-containing protein [Kiritimatiellia bacterium]